MDEFHHINFDAIPSTLTPVSAIASASISSSIPTSCASSIGSDGGDDGLDGILDEDKPWSPVTWCTIA
ncbi:B mating type pheromone [Pleurotus ostreatus PC15]|uniref:B mating type pheromone n=1 Tax=Pleurotus ostreatus (strain PC15) TaxID=1137138 RepID=A0A067N703_PLEO1|nr:B mating type pheromone [Pleurotus ostreatus PC15]